MGRSPVSAKVVRFIVGSTELTVRGHLNLDTLEKRRTEGKLGVMGEVDISMIPVRITKAVNIK